MPVHALTVPSAEAMAILAADVGVTLRSGDTLLLDGPVGAGKTHFARALIRSLQDTPEDVPSPTYTLVQIYDTRRGPVWHADLYRIGGSDEIVELGLTDAFETAICLIEWPDRLGDQIPRGALWLRFAPDPADPDSRILSIDDPDAAWSGRLTGVAA